MKIKIAMCFSSVIIFSKSRWLDYHIFWQAEQTKNEDRIMSTVYPALELQAVVGFGGKVPNGLLCHPDGVHLIYPLGSTIVVKNTVLGTQTFLQGHSNMVSCMELSRDGTKLASGQVRWWCLLLSSWWWWWWLSSSFFVSTHELWSLSVVVFALLVFFFFFFETSRADLSLLSPTTLVDPTTTLASLPIVSSHRSHTWVS